jgi:hypothetical protein
MQQCFVPASLSIAAASKSHAMHIHRTCTAVFVAVKRCLTPFGCTCCISFLGPQFENSNDVGELLHGLVLLHAVAVSG